MMATAGSRILKNPAMCVSVITEPSTVLRTRNVKPVRYFRIILDVNPVQVRTRD